MRRDTVSLRPRRNWKGRLNGSWNIKPAAMRGIFPIQGKCLNNMSLENFARLTDFMKPALPKVKNPFQLTECDIEMAYTKYRKLIDEVMSMMAKNRH